MYMPLSDNIEQDFTYCVQTMQSNYMGYLLQPLTFITSSLTDMAGSFTEQINDVRNMFNQTRNFITDITVSIYGIFLNIIIEFQKILDEFYRIYNVYRSSLNKICLLTNNCFRINHQQIINHNNPVWNNIIFSLNVESDATGT
jgi:hypothetical protein